jgi:hypothetical protein
MYAYKELEISYSVLQNQNLQLREELEKTRSGFDEAFETARLAHDVNTEFYAKLKLAVADRDDIYEQANTLAAMHHCECHDGRLWCAECLDVSVSGLGDRNPYPAKDRPLRAEVSPGPRDLDHG